MIRRPPRSTLDRSSAASDVYKRQVRGVAVEDQWGQGAAPGLLSDGGVVDVGQPHAAIGPEPRGIRTLVAGWEEEVPQPLGAGEGLQLGDEGVNLSLIHISEPTRPY